MKYLALILALAVAGCTTAPGTSPLPENPNRAAKVQAILEVVQRWEDEGRIKGPDLSEKTLRRLSGACDLAFIAAAGNPDAEAVYSRFEGACIRIRDAWIESQQPNSA